MGKVKKAAKIWLFVVLGFIGFVMVMVLAINPLLKNILAKKVEHELVGNFHYNYNKLSVDLLTRSVTFEQVTWRFPKDSTVFNHSGNIGRFTISGVSLMSLLRSNSLQIHEILFDSLRLVSNIGNYARQDSTAKITATDIPFNFYELIKGQLNSLEVDKIGITNGMATWLNPETKIAWRKIDGVSFDLRHIHLDSAIGAANNGWFTFQNATLEGSRGELFLADSLHKISLRKFQIDYSKQTINIDSFELTPLITKSQLHGVRTFETNLMEISIPKVRMMGVDVQDMMISNKLHIEHIVLDRLSLAVFRDKNPPIPLDLYIELPQKLLKNTKINLKIDSINWTNGHIGYEELSDLTQKTGVIFFSEVGATFHNITNDSLSIQQNSQANLNFSAKLMGKSRLEADITFDLLSDNGDHSMTGSLTQFDMTELNAASVPLRALSIRSGYIDKLEFDIRLNNYVADGKVTFIYSDLKIDKLDDEKLKSNALGDIFISLIANTFLMQTSNPSGNDDLRIGAVHYIRATDKGIINFWLKSIVDGMKSTILKSNKK
jgi:hypothetical protein